MNLFQEQDTIPAQRAADSGRNLRRFVLSIAALSVLFVKPLYGLVNLALHSELYSHIPLIPCVSAYLLWRNKAELAKAPLQTSPRAAAVAFGMGLAVLAFYWFAFRRSPAFNVTDTLSVCVFAFVSFVCGAYLLLLGKNLFSTEGFPIAFLLFLVPFPTPLTDGIETFFQHTSAAAAHAMLVLSNAPVFQQGLEFRLPGITIAVAPECSGIRSTLVLFITSLIAGHLFLQSAWKKTILTLFVIPLAIVRNGFRIFVIAQLCIQRGPEMIDSVIHRRGGPIFFLLSLVPFFLLLFYLRKSKGSAKRSAGSSNDSPSVIP